MSDLESFIPSESLRKSPEAFERFKEKMAAASAEIKAGKIQEQKHKQIEDKLAKILLEFIKSGQFPLIINLLIALLSKNFPAELLLAFLNLQFNFIILFNVKKRSSFSLNLTKLFKDFAVQSNLNLTLEAENSIQIWLDQIFFSTQKNQSKLTQIFKKETTIPPEFSSLTTHLLKLHFPKAQIDFTPYSNHLINQLFQSKTTHSSDFLTE